MPRSFSEDLKWRVVFLSYDRYSNDKISKLLYISRSFVYKVLKIYSKWGAVTDPWRRIPGRKKNL